MDDFDEKKLFWVMAWDAKRTGFFVKVEYLLWTGVIKSVGDIWYSFIRVLIYYSLNKYSALLSVR